MAGIIVASVSCAIALDGVQHTYEEVGGDRVRMDDASLATTIKARKNVWTLLTTLLNASDASTLETAIVTAPPLTCSGDALGASFSCAGQLLEKRREFIGGTTWYRVYFKLIEV